MEVLTLMLLHMFSLTHFTIIANAFIQTQITFDSHVSLTQDNSIIPEDNLRFSPTDVYPLPNTAAALKARPTTVYRPRSLEALRNARTRSMRYQESPVEPIEWDIKEVLGPDIEDRHTLAQLARMSGNAYALPGRPNWYEVDQAWNQVCISNFNFKEFTDYSFYKELPLRLGRYCGWFQRSRFPLRR